MFQKYKAAVLTAVLSVFAMASAHAELPAAAAGAFTATQTDGLALIDLAWPVMAAIVGGFVLLRLAKRAIKSAT